MPEGASRQHKADNTLVKALVRAFRWKRMLDSGDFVTIAELAHREGIAHSYMTRVLRLTLLASGIVEAILDGRQDQEPALAQLPEPFSGVWGAQDVHFGERPFTDFRPGCSMLRCGSSQLPFAHRQHFVGYDVRMRDCAVIR